MLTITRGAMTDPSLHGLVTPPVWRGRISEVIMPRDRTDPIQSSRAILFHVGTELSTGGIECSGLTKRRIARMVMAPRGGLVKEMDMSVDPCPKETQQNALT